MGKLRYSSIGLPIMPRAFKPEIRFDTQEVINYVQAVWQRDIGQWRIRFSTPLQCILGSSGKTGKGVNRRSSKMLTSGQEQIRITPRLC